MTTIRVIDYETTGTQEDHDAEIIEYGAYDLIENEGGGSWRIARPVASLIRPRNPIPPEARAVHHISDADVENAPELREMLDEFLDGSVIFAAHNAAFEEHFTPAENLRWICTYKCALVVWPEAPGHSNQCLRYWLGVDSDDGFVADRSMPPHRALPDAYVTAFILSRLLIEKSVDELLTISKYPALLTVMRFGKHKGMKFADAPCDYLEWIRDKSDMNDDTKFTARYVLQKRAKAGVRVYENGEVRR